MVPKTSEIEKKLSRAAKTRKVQKKQAGPNDWKGLGPHFGDFWDHFRPPNGTKILIFPMQKNKTISTNIL